LFWGPYLQGAAQGPDPVQPVVEQRVPDPMREAAPILLPAAGLGVPQGRQVGLLEGPVQLLQPVRRLRLAALRHPPIPPLRHPPLSALGPQLPQVGDDEQRAAQGQVHCWRDTGSVTGGTQGASLEGHRERHWRDTGSVTRGTQGASLEGHRERH